MLRKIVRASFCSMGIFRVEALRVTRGAPGRHGTVLRALRKRCRLLRTCNSGNGGDRETGKYYFIVAKPRCVHQRNAKHVLVPPGQSEPAQRPFLCGAGTLSPILWKCVLVGVSSSSPPWLANVRSTSFGCRTPRIVRFVGGNRGRCPTHQTPPPKTTQ